MPPVPSGPWFNEIARFLGPAYLRNAFTKGTEQEVRFLVAALGLEPGMRVLDVGCGPGRHALSLARRGLHVVGVDHSRNFLQLARDLDVLARWAGLEVDALHGVTPGRYRAQPVTLADPEILLLALRPNTFAKEGPTL